jgi:hypothetical protein
VKNNTGQKPKISKFLKSAAFIILVIDWPVMMLLALLSRPLLAAIMTLLHFIVFFTFIILGIISFRDFIFERPFIRVAATDRED